MAITKEKFKTFLIDVTKEMTIDEQIEFFSLLQKSWIPELIQDRIKRYSYCNSCNSYSKTKAYSTLTQTETRIEKIFICDENNELDEFGKVECEVTYSVCPKCKAKNEIFSKTIRILERF